LIASKDSVDVTLVSEDSNHLLAHKVLLVADNPKSNMSPNQSNNTVNASDIISLLNSSREIKADLEKMEKEEEEDTSFFSRFNLGLVEGFGKEVKEQFEKVKVKLSSDTWERKYVVAKDNYIEGLSDQGKLNFKVSFITSLIQQIQKLVHNHSIAFEFIQNILNSLEEKVKKQDESVKKIAEDIKGKVEEIAGGQVELEVGLKVDPIMVEVKTMKEEISKLKEEKEELEKEVDETRQWGLKGQLVISCRRGSEHLLTPQTIQGGEVKESPTEVCNRAIRGLSGLVFPNEDVLACHRTSRSDRPPTYVMKIGNWQANSTWDQLAAGLANSRLRGAQEPFPNTGVFINFHLTRRRVALLKEVGEARKRRKVTKFKVDSNGRILVTTARGEKGVFRALPWVEVASLADLAKVTKEELPLPTNNT